jgi:hypothetical protein
MDAPALHAGDTTFDRMRLFGNFVTNNTANDGTTDGSGGTATGQHSATDGSDSGADGGVLPCRRHPGTGAQTKKDDHDNSVERGSMHGIHGTNSYELRVRRLNWRQ